MEESRHQLLDISWESILKVCLAIVIFYAVYLVRDIFIWFLFGLIISVLLDPAIDFLRIFRIPRVVAAIITYLLIFGALTLVIYFTAPFFISEIKHFSLQVPGYFERVSPIFQQLKIESMQSIENLMQAITNSLEQISSSLFNALSTFFGGVVSAFFILSIAFFLSMEDNTVEKALVVLAPKRYEEYFLSLFERCKKKVSGWFGTRILACLFVAIVSFFAFYMFDIKYSFVLAFLAGITNFIPFLGPLIFSLLLLIIVGVSDSLAKALVVLAIFVIIQQIENNVVSPVLTKKFVGLPTVLVLISLAVGAEIFGFLGAIFSIPVAGIIYEFVREFLQKRKEEESLAV